MNNSKKEYSPSKIALLAILELLKDGSSADKPLTIKQIVELLKLRYDYSISRNTVKDSLEKLATFYGKDTICCKESPRGDSTYTTSYYYSSTTELSELDQKLKLIQNAIKENRNQERGGKKDRESWIEFYLNGYGIDNTLNHVYDEKTKVFPLDVIEYRGKLYLIVTFDAKKIYHYRVDLMTDIQEVAIAPKLDATLLKQRRAELNNKDDYIKRHPSMFGGTVKSYTLEVKYDNGNSSNGLNYLHDAFGDWMVLQKGETSAKVVVTAPEAIMEILLRRYANKIELVR